MVRLNKLMERIQSLIASRNQDSSWAVRELPEISGESENVSVRCYPFPVKENERGVRKFLYPDFGSDFRHELMDVELANWTALNSAIELNGKVSVTLSHEKIGRVKVDVDCRKMPKKMQFYSDLADAVIDAFNKAKVSHK